MRSRRLSPLLVLAPSILFFFWKITLTSEYSFLGSESWGLQFYPWFQFAAHEIQYNHTMPLWDPYSFSGTDFVGQMQPAVFYPWNWIVYLGLLREMLSIDWIHLWILVSYLFGAWGMYRCGRTLGLQRPGAVAAAAAFIFSGSMASSASRHVAFFNASLWLPIVFLFFNRALGQTSVRRQLKFVLLAGGAWGMSFLAGHHEPGIYIGLALGVWVLLYLVKPAAAVGRTSALVLLLAAAACAFLASAVQIIPSYNYARTAIRHAGASVPPGAQIPLAELESTQRLLPRHLLFLLFPVSERPGDSDIYFGILPLLLAAYGFFRSRKVDLWRFAALALFSVLYAFAGIAPVHGPLQALPFVRLARESDRILFVFHFAMAFLAGGGLDLLLGKLAPRDRRGLRTLTRYLGTFIVLTGIILVVISMLGSGGNSNLIVELDRSFPRIYYVWLMMVIAFALLRWRLVHGGVHAKFAGLLLAAALLDLSAANTREILPKNGSEAQRSFYPKVVHRQQDRLQYIYNYRNQEGRWDDPSMAFPAGFQFIFRIRTTLGRGVTSPAEYLDFYQKQGRVLDLLNVRYQYALDPAGSPVLTERSSSRPRFQLTRNLQVLGDRSFDQWLTAADYNPDAIALTTYERDKLPDEALLAGQQKLQVQGDVRLLWENNRRIELQVENHLPALLVLSENYQGGWYAYVDRIETPVVKCNGRLRGIWLPVGSHRISFRYLPPGLMQGLTFSLLYWMTLGAALFMFRRRSESSPLCDRG